MQRRGRRTYEWRGLRTQARREYPETGVEMSDSERTPVDVKAVDTSTVSDDMLIILPVRNLVLFPGTVLPVTINRERSLAGAQEAVRAQRKIGFLLQKDPETQQPGP